MTTLAQLTIGMSAIIKSFTDVDTSLKLMEMGCVPGETITISNIAPMGDPIAINISGYQLSLRKNEAAKVIVTPIS